MVLDFEHVLLRCFRAPNSPREGDREENKVGDQEYRQRLARRVQHTKPRLFLLRWKSVWRQHGKSSALRLRLTCGWPQSQEFKAHQITEPRRWARIHNVTTRNNEGPCGNDSVRPLTDALKINAEKAFPSFVASALSITISNRTNVSQKSGNEHFRGLRTVQDTGLAGFHLHAWAALSWSTLFPLSRFENLSDMSLSTGGEIDEQYVACSRCCVTGTAEYSKSGLFQENDQLLPRFTHSCCLQYFYTYP